MPSPESHTDLSCSLGGLKNSYTWSIGSKTRVDGVVSIRLNLVRFEVKRLHLRGRDHFPGLEPTLHVLGGDLQFRSGTGAGRVGEEGLKAVERPSRPVLGDFAEQAVLDRVPLGGTGGIVDDGDDQSGGY